MKKLLIAVDPGFDTMKVVANGLVFKFPFNVIETDERKMSDYKIGDDFILYQDNMGGTYRVGQYAREMLFDNKSRVDTFYTEDRFISDEFRIGLDTAIALSILKNNLYDQMDNLDIELIIALPHACRTTYASTVIGSVAGKHSFLLRYGKSAAKRYTYKITPAHVKTVSQTIAAMLGETSDDDGFIDEEKFFFLTNGPTLVLDGGYYTMGMVVISRSGNVDDDKTESDTHHAMANVNEKVAEMVRPYRPEITHYAVEYLLSKNNGQIRYMDNGKAHTLELSALRKEKAREVCDDLIQYLNKKYNDLLDFEYVLVTGGTGACFYDRLLEYYKDTGIMDETRMVLTSGMLNGTKYPIEFAIAIGAYKGLKNMVNN